MSYKYKDLKQLEKFLDEFFDFEGLVEVGVLKKEMKGDCVAQAERICKVLNLKNIYEYGAFEFVGHITYGDPDDPSGLTSTSRPLHVDENGKLQEEPMITVIENIYKS